MNRPTLFLTAGQPGTGKTAAARRIEAEQSALRLKDEWMKALYGHGNPAASASDVIAGPLIQTGMRALEVGAHVIVELGL